MTPQTETELSALIKDATGPLRIIGGGTRPIGRSTGAPLKTTGLRGITLYDPGALTLVAATGTPLEEIMAALDAENQRLAFEPMDHRAITGSDGTPTIGGVVAGNVSGPRRVAVGACRDFMLGVRFVDGQGEIVKNGGRVMKNVTGYDLVRLLTGSLGTLGVLTEVALKVLPKPETYATLVLQGLEASQAVAAMAAAMGSPFEVTGAAHQTGDAPRTLLRLEGFADSVVYRTGRLTAELSQFGKVQVITDPEESTATWADIRDAQEVADATGDLWRVSVKPGDAPAILAALPDDSPALLDWAGGLIWVAVPEGHDLRAAMSNTGGHATLIRGTGCGPVFHPEPAPLAAISQGLRDRFDPRGILNTGIMG